MPVLLSPDMVEGLDMILKVKPKYSKEKDLVFAVSNAPIKGWTALKQVAEKVEDLDRPELISSTNFRKYLATMSQVNIL